MHIVYIIHKSIKKYSGIPLSINLGEVPVPAQPEPDSIIQNPVPVKPEPDLIFKYPVNRTRNRNSIFKIRFRFRFLITLLRSYPSREGMGFPRDSPRESGKVWVFLGISLGLRPREIPRKTQTFPLSLRQSLRKPIPSLHWLIRISHSTISSQHQVHSI